MIAVVALVLVGAGTFVGAHAWASLMEWLDDSGKEED